MKKRVSYLLVANSGVIQCANGTISVDLIKKFSFSQICLNEIFFLSN